MEGHGELGLLGEHFDNGFLARMRDNNTEEYESRSGSDNFDGASGDDQDAGDEPPQRRRKKYHRHTPHQIQELEAFFKECPHPDEKQRADLSRRLNLEIKQVKFWFQNRRTQMKTILERHENSILKTENERLLVENGAMKEALANPMCQTCGGPTIPGQISFDEHQIRIENARLKDELNRICALAQKFLGRPLSSLAGPMALSNPNSGLELGIGRNENTGLSNLGMSLPMGLDLGDGVLGTPSMMAAGMRSSMGLLGNEVQLEKNMVIDLALAAMDELIKIAQADSPLWIKSSNGEKEILNLEEYARMSSPFICPTAPGYVTEATRETAALIINSTGLIETLMDPVRWSEMFPSIISRAVTLDVISNGMAGTRNGALQVMQAEIQLLSPLVPVREMIFLRFCKQHAEGLWAVVDASVDVVGRNFKRLPSGFIVQDTPNGLSKITWVEHCQYDESIVHGLYRPMVNSGLGFGAHRWIATLQRQCECLAMHMFPAVPNEDSAITQDGRRSMMRLAQRMTDCFFSGICNSSAHKWETHHLSTLGDDIKVMSRKCIDVPGEPLGIVLCAATSVRMPVSRQRLFSYLCDQRERSKWDILCGGAQLQELLHITKGQVHGNSISVIRFNANNGNDGNTMMVLQEIWTDSSCSAMVYAPVHMHNLSAVIEGGDSSYVALLPSGFAIYPDGHSGNGNGNGDGDNGADNGGGCLLTVGFQILQDSLPTAKITEESIDTVDNLISGTIGRIKAGVRDA